MVFGIAARGANQTDMLITHPDAIADLDHRNRLFCILLRLIN